MAQKVIFDALGNIVLLLHWYKFSLQTGRNTNGEGYYLKTFPIEIEKMVVYGLTESRLLRWLKWFADFFTKVKMPYFCHPDGKFLLSSVS